MIPVCRRKGSYFKKSLREATLIEREREEKMSEAIETTRDSATPLSLGFPSGLGRA